MISDIEIKLMLTHAGFMNAPSPYMAMGGIENFRRLLKKLDTAETLLTDLRDAGSWYDSALEIDVYEGKSGEELKKRIDSFFQGET